MKNWTKKLVQENLLKENEKIYNKLVRSKIPEVIEKITKTHIAND